MSDQNPPQYPSYPTGGEQPAPAYGSGAPPAYGYPPQQPYYAGQPGPTVPYASWGARFGAYLLDGLIVVAVSIVPFIVGGIILGTTSTASTDANGYAIIDGGNPVGYLLLALGYILIVAFGIWNQVFRQGRKGQTLGKKIVGIQVVRADSGQFMGAGTAFLRWIMMSILGGICFLDYLWPLWDDKKQTWHDKVVGSVVIAK